MSSGRPDLDAILSRLKDFQRDSASYAFRRLYRDPDSARRFLISDEADLGKTLVASGITAMAIDQLWDPSRSVRLLRPSAWPACRGAACQQDGECGG